MCFASIWKILLTCYRENYGIVFYLETNKIFVLVFYILHHWIVLYQVCGLSAEQNPKMTAALGHMFNRKVCGKKWYLKGSMRKLGPWIIKKSYIRPLLIDDRTIVLSMKQWLQIPTSNVEIHKHLPMAGHHIASKFVTTVQAFNYYKFWLSGDKGENYWNDDIQQ